MPRDLLYLISSTGGLIWKRRYPCSSAPVRGSRVLRSRVRVRGFAGSRVRVFAFRVFACSRARGSAGSCLCRVQRLRRSLLDILMLFVMTSPLSALFSLDEFVVR